MTTVTVSSHITAPVEHVFGLFTDIEHASAHVGGIKKIEMLTPGRFELGTRWRETREVLGRLDSAEMEVTAFERNRTYTITHHKGGVGVETVFTFEPSGGGTRVTLSFTLETSGLPPGLLTPISWAIANKVRDVLTHDLIDLKRSVEAYVH
ncbi:MAG: SRPBCC family protein [Acidobacteriia bacterium]|nr:SRPBCC family protein [Terriglobia bacterium]